MRKEDKNTYTSPKLEMVELRNEQGFAQSNPAYEHGNEGSPWEWD